MKGKKLGAGLRGLLNCLIPILLAFLVGGIVIAAIGENPLETYWILLKSPCLPRWASRIPSTMPAP